MIHKRLNWKRIGNLSFFGLFHRVCLKSTLDALIYPLDVILRLQIRNMILFNLYYCNIALQYYSFLAIKVGSVVYKHDL